MAEYIDRQAAIAEIKRIYCTDCFNYNGVKCRACDFENAMDVLEDMPKADVAPVRHGHWIDCEDEYSSYVRCSVCGDEYTNWEADCAHTDFCPGCGADMRGADNGE